MTPGATLDARDAGAPGKVARTRGDAVELVAACVVLLAVGIAGLYLMVRPGPTALDRFGFDLVSFRPHSALMVAVSRLGSPFVVVAGSAAGFVWSFRRDRARAVALLVGPVFAVVTCDWVMKPVVGRTFHGVLCFPSGTVAAVAAVATAAVLAAPDARRWGVAAVGGATTILMGLSVVALGWHYPTDAAAGAAFGGGVVLLGDCGARRLAVRLGGIGHAPRSPGN